MKERGVGRTCSTGIHCAQVARVFAAIFAAWGWVPGPPESAFCLVLGTFSQESRALGHKFMGLVILSSFDKDRMGKSYGQGAPRLQKGESGEPVNE